MRTASLQLLLPLHMMLPPARMSPPQLTTLQTALQMPAHMPALLALMQQQAQRQVQLQLAQIQLVHQPCSSCMPACVPVLS
jgi:hypothetical protein